MGCFSFYPTKNLGAWGRRDGLEQVQGTRDVAAAVLLGLEHALARRLQGGEMHHAVEAALGRRGLEAFQVEDVAHPQGHVRRQVLAPAGGKVVEDHGLVPGPPQRLADMRADITRAADHPNLHASPKAEFRGI